MTSVLSFILGFAVCAYLTNRMLANKARNNESLILDEDGSVYWKKSEEANR